MRSYGIGGAVRNPGPEYLDHDDVLIVDRVPQTPVDSATEVPDEEPPVECWPGADSGSEDVVMMEHLETEAERGAVGRTSASG